MGKNFAAQLAALKEEHYNKGLMDGLTLDKMVAGIASNNAHGHGYTRIERLENEYDRILMEEIQGKEPEEIMAGLQRKFDKIGGLKRAKKTD